MIPIADQLSELRREMKQRDRVYPRWIADGRLQQADADLRRARLQAAIETLEGLAAKDRLILHMQDFPRTEHLCRAALGPWMPTHQHENGTLAREVVRAQFGVGADSIPVVILDDVFHRPFVVAAEKVERDFRPLTEAEARALLSEIEGGPR